jgi:VWA domain-containing protein/type IX secretion system substrate protein
MKMLSIIAVCLLFAVFAANSQSYSLYGVDTTNYPIMSARFFVFEKDNKQKKDFILSEIKLFENDIPRAVISITCPPTKPPLPISTVLTIDVSGSMFPGGIILAKEVAQAWVDAMPAESEECCITAFGSTNYYVQDFTNDKNLLSEAIQKKLVANGGTDFNAGFIDLYAGGILAAKKGKYKKIIIFLTDGNGFGDEYDIIQEALGNDVTIYCVAMGLETPRLLQNITVATGGAYFDGLRSVEELLSAYEKIRLLATGAEPCTVEWKSDAWCPYADIVLKSYYTNYKREDYDTYSPSKKSAASLEIDPAEMKFQESTLNTPNIKKITVTAVNDYFYVSNILVSNPLFDIYPKTFALNPGESKELTVTFTPIGEIYQYAEFEFVSEKCSKYYFAIGSYIASAKELYPLELTQPNGGEVFLVGSDTLITWKGVLPSDTVHLEYSYDNGENWNLITEEAFGLEYTWKNIPRPTSDECLLVVKQLGVGNDSPEAPDIEWENSFGGSMFDYAMSVIQSSEAGYLVVGTSQSDDGDITQARGNNDYFVVKIDDEGNKEWSRNLGGYVIDDASCVIQTKSGDYLIAGTSTSTDWDISDPKGGYDAWIVLISQAGTLLWEKSIGLDGDDVANSIIQVQDGGFIFVGSKLGGQSWMVKLDLQGNLQWEKTYAGTVISDVEETSNGGLILAGYVDASDFVVVRTNVQGEMIWKKNFGGNDKDQAFAVTQNDEGYFFVVGESQSEGIERVGAKGHKDVWLLKLNPSGEMIWQNSYGGSRDDTGRDIIKTHDGGIVIAGGTFSDDKDVSSAYNSSDFWMFKIDSNGELIWERTLGGNGTDLAFSIKQTDDLGYVVAGTTLSEDGDVTKQQGMGDFWVVKLSPEKKPFRKDTSDAVFAIDAPIAEADIVDMGKVLVGSSKDSIIVDFIKNKGHFHCFIESLSIKTGDETNFSAVTNLPASIAKDNSYSAKFNFTPDKKGTFSSQIYILTQSDTLIYEIRGEGVVSKFEIESEILNFGIVEVSNSKDTAIVLIKNNSVEDVIIDKTEIFGPDREQFEILEGGGGFVLEPNTERELKLRFAPESVGRTSSRIAFHYDGAGSPAIANLYGAGIAGTLKVMNDSAYAGGRVTVRLNFEGVEVAKFAQLVDSYDGILRVQKTILAPVFAANFLEIRGDSTYITFSGNLNPDDKSIAKIRMVAGLGMVTETTINIEEMNWYYEGERIPYEAEYDEGLFTMLGICEEGGQRLFNVKGEVQMIVMPNPVSDKLKLELSLIEKGDNQLVITNSGGKEMYSQSLVSDKADTYTIEIDISVFEQGAYYINFQTPTIQLNESFVKIK